MNYVKRYVLLALLLVAVVCSWLQPLDHMAKEQAQDGLKRAVASFATARALNAVISVVQGTEFAVQPLGVGVSFAPGQLLDPINDLVEKFSDLMLMVSVLFGIQVLLISMGVHWGMSLALTLVATIWAVMYWWSKNPPELLGRVLIALLLVRFIVPVAGMASDFTYRAFMESEYVNSQKGIEQSAQVLGSLAPSNQTVGMKWWDLSKQVERFKGTVERTVDYTIRLIVVFLMQTLVLPLMVFWILIRTGRMLTLGMLSMPDGYR
jgi:hypothetical protein